MPVGLLIDNQRNHEIYDKVWKELDMGAHKPEGCLLHFAGPSPLGGWRIVEVWESEEHQDRFFKERLEPAFQTVGLEGRPQPQMWPIHNYTNWGQVRESAIG